MGSSDDQKDSWLKIFFTGPLAWLGWSISIFIVLIILGLIMGSFKKGARVSNNRVANGNWNYGLSGYI